MRTLKEMPFYVPQNKPDFNVYMVQNKQSKLSDFYYTTPQMPITWTLHSLVGTLSWRFLLISVIYPYAVYPTDLIRHPAFWHCIFWYILTKLQHWYRHMYEAGSTAEFRVEVLWTSGMSWSAEEILRHHVSPDADSHWLHIKPCAPEPGSSQHGL